MKKATVLLLTIIVLITFISCDKSSPRQTMDNGTITPTIAVTPSEQPSNLDTASEKPNRITYRTAKENKEYYEDVESRKTELYSIETQDYTYYYDGFFNNLVYAIDKKEGRTLYYLNGNCIFIMTDNVIDPTYEETEKAGETVYQSFEDMMNNDEIAPFSREVGKVLPDQVDKILSGKALELPTNYYLLDYCVGDLNSDGQNDMAVVIEQAPGENKGSRVVFILLQNNGVYETAYENTKMILGRGDGGIDGDPYGGIAIKNGELHIYDYGGSNYRWSHDYTFIDQSDKLILSQIKETNSFSDTMYGTVDYYNFIDGTKETRSYYDGDYEDGTKEDPYNDLLLYSGKIITLGMIDFENAYAWCDLDFKTDPPYIRPDMGKYEYGQHEYQSIMQHSTEEMLDKVQQKYFPDMKKVKLKMSEAISDNYLKLLGYRIPAYYYTDGKYILCYNDFETLDGERYLHQIYYYSINNSLDDYKYYEFWDDTGEEIVTEN